MKIGLKSTFLSVFLLLGSAATQAEHAAVAYVENGSWGGWSVKSTKKDAEAAALNACREANPGKKCSIQYAYGISRAESETRVGFSTSTKSKSDAEKQALENCNDPGCKTVWTKSTPGFYAVLSPMKNGEATEYYLQHGANTGKWALEEGKRNCEKSHGETCEVQAFGAIKGNFTVAKATQPSKPQASAPSCRPNTSHIRCSSQCFNGDCTVTYENGCEMRVQVRPQFNGTSWVYPPPSC